MVAMEAAPQYAQVMSKMTNLAAINTAMKSVPVERGASAASGAVRRARG